MQNKGEWTLQAAKRYFANCQDVVVHPVHIADSTPYDDGFIIYNDGLIDASQINDFVLPRIQQSLEEPNHFHTLWLDAERLDDKPSFEQIADHVFSGQLIVSFRCHKQPFHAMINIANRPERSPEESNTESSIKGPRDGFTEQLSMNVALIRKRLRSSKLTYAKTTIGTRSKTNVGLLYFEDLVPPEMIEEAEARLNQIHTEGLIGFNQLEEALSDSPYSLLPTVDYSGRPDHAAECLLEGKFVVMMDGSPMALIAPAGLVSLLKSPEDNQLSFFIAAFQRLIRYSGLAISLLLPGLWIALTSFNIEQIPLSFLATISVSRVGIPFSTPFEAFIMLGLFELFREAGIRLPKAVGGTVTVVGGLIVGDAAVRAGLTSPTMIVIIATTTIATFTLVNQTLAGFVSIIRILLMIAASLFGLFGFFMGFYVLLLYAAWCKSFGKPFLAPLSPLNPAKLADTVFKIPWVKKGEDSFD